MIYILEGKEGAARAVENGSVAVVVDSLRSSATLSAYFAVGAAEVTVCSSIEQSRAFAKERGIHASGEHNTIQPDDFLLGNSPTQALGADIAGKKFSFASMNGAPLINACKGAAEIYVGSVTNATALAKAVEPHRMDGRDIVIIPAGNKSGDASEDTSACVLLADAIGPDLDPGFEAEAALWKSRIISQGLDQIFRESEHGRLLLGNGLEDDIALCATPDHFSGVPRVSGFIEFHNSPLAVLAV